MSQTSSHRVRVGLAMPPKPPFGTMRQALLLCRLLRFDSFMVWDHLQDLFPQALWNPETTWTARGRASPHQFYDYQTALGALSPRAGQVRLGVAVTDPIRRHPVVIAQAMLTLAQLTRRAPILGIGTGERANIEPIGLDFTGAVGRLEEALQIIRLCFDGQSPLTFAGKHYRLDQAYVDLKAPAGRTPRIWLGAHGPRMLRLTGTYADGWLPTGMLTPEEYQAKLSKIRDAARTIGRDPDRIMPAFQPVIVAAGTEAEARALLDHKLVRFVALLASAAVWERLGHAHPLGRDYRGYIDFFPERYSGLELEAAIAAVPSLAETDAGLIWGTPERIVRRLHDYVDAGMRYVVPQLPALMVSRRAALFNIKLLHAIAQEFRPRR